MYGLNSAVFGHVGQCANSSPVIPVGLLKNRIILNLAISFVSVMASWINYTPSSNIRHIKSRTIIIHSCLLNFFAIILIIVIASQITFIHTAYVIKSKSVIIIRICNFYSAVSFFSITDSRISKMVSVLVNVTIFCKTEMSFSGG